MRTMDDGVRQARLRALPSIDELLGRAEITTVLDQRSRGAAVAVLRDAVGLARARALAGADAPFSLEDVHHALARSTQTGLRAVLNATGVVLHTNLGRAPLPARALERLAALGGGYTNLELDLEAGERGSRYQPVVAHLCALTGAESALVVNNGAAAVLLSLSALAAGREAIVSRGELVEIGGGFRVPDVMAQSNARLVEVGTTNRTRLSDYEAALGPQTGALVKVHRSNFAIVGFTEEVTTAELARLARARGVPLFEDLGSGALAPLGPGLPDEKTVAATVRAGADLVAFSGDKLLGGPQAGIIVGRRALIDRLARHPLNRALRVDKLTVVALEATLELYREGLADEAVPARALVQQAPALLEVRATRLQALLAAHGVPSRVLSVSGRVGGGSMPLAELSSFAVAVAGPLGDRLRALRTGTPAVLGRVADDSLELDVRCIADADVEALAEAVARVFGAPR